MRALLRGLLIAAALLCVRGAAGAEDRLRAAESAFSAAHRLFEAGDYEAARDRYREAYRLAPHPYTLYNLALTYERLLDYDAAIDAFQRYLEQPLGPDRQTQRVERSLRLLGERTLRRLRSLPARVSVSAIPEAAQVTIQASDRAGAQPPQPLQKARTPTVFQVPAGRYLLRYQAPGYLPEEVEIDAHVGQALLVQRNLRYRQRPLSVVAIPPARLFLDDRPLGATPYRGLTEVGPHRLRLERLFYLTHAEQLAVAPAAAPAAYRVRLEPSGLSELLLGGLVAGGAMGLVALRVITSDELENQQHGYAPAVAALLPAVLGAGIFALGGGNNVPRAEAQLILGNGAWGAMVGFGLGLGIDAHSLYPHTLAAGAGILGGMIGLGVYRWRGPPSGIAALYNSAALWGTTVGALAWGYLAALDSRNAFFGRDPGLTDVPDRPAYIGDGGWALCGGALAGIGAGLLLAGLDAGRGLSRQQVALIDLGGAAGGTFAGLLGLGIGYAATGVWQQDGRQSAAGVAALSAIGGSAAGLVAAALLTRYRGGLRRSKLALLHANW